MTTRAVVLLGGQGTRLRPFTLTAPKPLLPIANRPMFAYQLALLHSSGIREVVLSVGAAQPGFRPMLRLADRLGIRMRLAVERRPLGTAGGIRNAAVLFRGRGPFFVFNGDILADFDLRGMDTCHRRMRAAVTICLVRVADPSAFGLVVVDSDGRVRRFVEKPGPQEASGDSINAGAYLMEPEVLNSIPAGRQVSVERETFPDILRAGMTVAAWRHEGLWLDVGTLPTYLKANAGVVLNGVPPALSAAADLFPDSGRVPTGLTVEGKVVIGKNVTAGRGAVVRGWAAVGDGCVLGSGCIVENSVVFPGAAIGPGASVVNSIVGTDALVGAHATVRGCALGWGRGSRISPVVGAASGQG